MFVCVHTPYDILVNMEQWWNDIVSKTKCVKVS
jgi:hypothetical protein